MKPMGMALGFGFTLSGSRVSDVTMMHKSFMGRGAVTNVQAMVRPRRCANGRRRP